MMGIDGRLYITVTHRNTFSHLQQNLNF